MSQTCTLLQFLILLYHLEIIRLKHRSILSQLHRIWRNLVSTNHDINNSHPANSEDRQVLAAWTDADINKIKHRIDRRIVTTLGVMYCISLMDRTNLSAAAIAGMQQELQLTVLVGGISRYSVVTLVFFATYVVFQFPSTVVIRYLGPRIHLTGITLA